MTAIPTNAARTTSPAVYLAAALLLVLPLTAAVAALWWNPLTATAQPAVSDAAVMRIIGELPNQGHADAKHPEAAAIRSAMREGRCLELQLWYSDLLGTVLGLCKMQDGQWGGRVLRVYSAGRPLNGSSYECTAFCSRSYDYWARVIRRDGYQPAPMEVINYVRSLGH